MDGLVVCCFQPPLPLDPGTSPRRLPGSLLHFPCCKEGEDEDHHIEEEEDKDNKEEDEDDKEEDDHIEEEEDEEVALRAITRLFLEWVGQQPVNVVQLSELDWR